MDADQKQPAKPTNKKIFKWVVGVSALIVLICCGIPTLVYVFFIPTKYELRVGNSLPDTAEVLNSQYEPAGMDWTYRFEIRFSDDQARDQMIQAWNLQQGTQDTPYSAPLTIPIWWPSQQIESIQSTGEWYFRDDDHLEKWWRVWVDRKNSLLYVETGRW